MQDDPLSVTQTWPSARINTTFVPRTLKASSSQKLFDALQNARDYIDKTSDMNDLPTQNTRSIIQNLCGELEKRKAMAMSRRRSRQSGSQMLGVIREGVPLDNENRLREEPHFESMIFNDVGRRLSMRRAMSSIADPENAIVDPMEQIDENGDVDLSDLYEGLDPVYIRAIPHISMIIFTIGYMLIGAAIFQSLDDKLSQKPYRDVVMFTYSLIATIGWGDSSAGNQWSRIFCVIYTLFGTPIMYSSLANLGKVLSEFYTVDWLYYSAVVRGKKPTAKVKQIPDRMSIKSCLNLIFIHFFIGLILFNGVVQNLGVVESIYFIAISVQTIGLGDFAPKPDNWLGTIIVIVYLTFGIIIVSALFLNISYYFQLFYYVYMSDWLHNAYEWLRGRRDKITDSQNK